MMELRRVLTSTPQRLYWDFLGAYTFTGQKQERYTISPQPSWAKYDFLFIKTDMAFEKGEDTTDADNKNWFWYKLDDGVNTASNYDGDSASGARGIYYSAIVVYDDNNQQWQLHILKGGRPAILNSTATLAELTVIFGAYYGATYAVPTGTIEVYGGSFREGSAS